MLEHVRPARDPGVSEGPLMRHGWQTTDPEQGGLSQLRRKSPHVTEYGNNAFKIKACSVGYGNVIETKFTL